MRGHLSGSLRLGVIPAALPSVSLVTAPFNARHPEVAIEIRSMSSRAIERALEDFEIEAGITYLDNVAAATGAFGARRNMSWAQAAAAPLCLLSADMQNRRIVDRIFEEVGVEVESHIETNSFVAICSHVRHGEWSSILPHTYFYVFRDLEGIRAIPLVDPLRTHAVGLVTPDRTPLSPLAEALVRCAASLDLGRELEMQRPLPRRER